jgi:hypothetical protein
MTAAARPLYREASLLRGSPRYATSRTSAGPAWSSWRKRCRSSFPRVRDWQAGTEVPPETCGRLQDPRAADEGIPRSIGKTRFALAAGRYVDWTCSIARLTGTNEGTDERPSGEEIPPTGESFEVDFCTVARRDYGQIVEENLFSTW